MALEKLFGKIKGGNDTSMSIDEDEYVELDAVSEEGEKKIRIRIHTLREFNDVEKVQDMLRDNNIVWVKIKPLKEKDMTDLKRAIDRLKKTVKSINGDVAGVDEDWLVACPQFAQIHR